MSTQAVLIADVVLSGLAVVLCVLILYRSGRTPSVSPILEQRLLSIEAAIGRSDTTIRDEFGRGLDETREGSRSLREEVTGLFGNLGGALRASLGEKLDTVTGQITALTEVNERRQEVLRKTVEERLDAIRKENTEKLEQMRQTVDEKLKSTLDQRLGASFQIVADRLEQVYRSMGEMQTLASGVGDLKRLLTNVKSRGTWGVVTLGNLLEEMMAPDQYARNVEIVPGSNQRVEYAVRLPGDGEIPVWLPVDAKFPVEDYERLVDASHRGDVDAVEIAAKGIETVIRGSAKAICEKYIHSPHLNRVRRPLLA